MLIASNRPPSAPAHPVAAKRRRGVALVFVLVFVIAMAALAMSSIFMASNASLLAKSYDKERSLKYAAEAALAIGKSRVNSDPLALQLPVDSIYRALLWKASLNGADNRPLSGGVYVNVYAGPTGSTSGQSGRFASIVAEARDANGNGYIRRLELAQESFAKYAYWSNTETNSGSTIYFTGGDELWGPVWSNDNISIAGNARFHDLVGTAGTINITSGTPVFDKGYQQNQRTIALPTNSVLSLLKGYAAAGGYDFSVYKHRGPNNDETQLRDRIEFVAYDMGGERPDSTDDGEGFFRRYTANVDTDLRGDWSGSSNANNVKLCGDWHYAGANPQSAADTGLKFYPASVHNTSWFKSSMAAGLLRKYPSTYTSGSTGTAATTANAHASASVSTIMTTATEGVPARCYLAGDTHLVAVERGLSVPGSVTYTVADIQKGGDDTTFTPVGNLGSWLLYSATPDTQVVRMRAAAGMGVEAKYLFPIARRYNNNAKGVIYEAGNIGLSGTVNGLLTLYAKGSIVFLDDLRYANDPATGRCHDILGLITDLDAVVAENALLEPVNVGTVTKNVDDTKDFYLHAVVMALGTSFRVQNYGGGPTNVNDCDVTNNGRGCIYLSGGLIQASRGAVGMSGGTGFAKRYTYDRCAVVNPPPYFPTTGRFTDNRYIELNPQGFDPKRYFQTLDPNK